jgi:tripartite ATP-independent transporter DctM subunit
MSYFTLIYLKLKGMKTKMSIFCIVLFIILMILGIPIAVSLGISCVATLYFFTDIPLNLIAQSMFSSMNSFVMAAVPLFVFAGIIMDEGGVADKIYNFSNSAVGWIHGGLGHVNILTSLIFAGMSGSSVADIASTGKIEINQMHKHGYLKEYAAALTISSSMLASIIPPSILMVVAASVANVSVGKALFGGLVPGIIIGIAFMIYNYIYCKKHNIGDKIPFDIKNLLKNFVVAIPALLAPIMLLGGMFTGFFTPTEAAGIAVLYAILISMFVYKGIKLSDLPNMLFRTTKTTGTILFIAVTAKAATWIFEYDGLPARVAAAITSLSSNTTIVMFIIFAFLIVLGMFMDATAAIYMVVPILLPAVISVGIDPLFFVIFLVLCLTLGLITPPVGVCLYTCSNVVNLKIESIISQLMPWIIITIIILAIFILFPELVMSPIYWLFPEL